MSGLSAIRTFRGTQIVTSGLPVIRQLPHLDCRLMTLTAKMAAVLAVCVSANAQMITIQLLDAKSGKPMKNENVTVKWDKDFKSSEVSVTDVGTATVQIPNGAKEFVMLAGPRKGNEPNRVAYTNCNGQSPSVFLVANVMNHGIVPENICGDANVVSHPGEIVFWARPLPFWDFQ
jgi:hypothetical protein